MNSLTCPNILRLASEISSPVINGTSADPSTFTPIDELLRSDGDLVLMFLSGNGVYFYEKSNDPWYRATRDNGNGIYQTDVAASPLGCVQQFQFCDGGSKCGTLASLVDAAADAAPLFMLVGMYVKERDNNKIKGGKTGVILWSKVYCLSIKDIGKAYIFYINGR